uniref:Uncharacterized protein n=1 Tax=Kalanchoe fedtschenkoi TaxID=63787 RepID=A0A7N0V4B3_KALFE
MHLPLENGSALTKPSSFNITDSHIQLILLSLPLSLLRFQLSMMMPWVTFLGITRPLRLLTRTSLLNLVFSVSLYYLFLKKFNSNLASIQIWLLLLGHFRFLHTFTSSHTHPLLLN